MKAPWFWCLLALCPFGVWVLTLRSAVPERRPESHRSPIDVAVLPGGRLALTANHTPATLS